MKWMMSALSVAALTLGITSACTHGPKPFLTPEESEAICRSPQPHYSEWGNHEEDRAQQCGSTQRAYLHTGQTAKAMNVYQYACGRIGLRNWDQKPGLNSCALEWEISAKKYRLPEADTNVVMASAVKHCLDDKWLFLCSGAAEYLEKTGDKERAKSTYLLACYDYRDFDTCDRAAQLGAKVDKAWVAQAKAESAAELGRMKQKWAADEAEDAARQAESDRADAEAEARRQAQFQAMLGQIASTSSQVPMYVPPARYPTPVAPAPASSARTANAPSRPFAPTPVTRPPTSASYSPFQNGPGGSQGGPNRPTPGGGNSANAACINMNAAVTFTYQRPIGPGHCTREITGRLTNRSSQKLYCRFDFYNGGMKKGDSGSVSIAPGQTMGGEGSGIYSCEADAIKFVCFPDTPGAGSCPVNP